MANNFTGNDGGVNNSSDVGYRNDETFTINTITGAFFILIFIFSVMGNCLLLCVLVFYENLKNVTNLFTLNLACSDLIFTVTLPFWAVDQLQHWIFGDFACKFMTLLYFLGFYSSVILLTAITVDRFIIVVLHNWPSKPLRRQRCAMVACAAAWAISIAASVSDAIKVKVKIHFYSSTCEEHSDVSDEKLGYYLQVSLLFFLPFAIVIFCYSAILKTVLQAKNRKRHRTVVVVLCIVAAFFICWGPYNIVLVLSLYEPESHYEVAYNICLILAYSHCCMNPLLYMLSQKLRRHLLDLLRCEKARRRKRERGTGQSTSVFQNVAFTAHNSAVMLELHSK